MVAFSWLSSSHLFLESFMNGMTACDWVVALLKETGTMVLLMLSWWAIGLVRHRN
jgi:hypothetical protein